MAFWVVSYDVSDDRRRTKLAKVIKGFGERVQKSVFECDLEEWEYERLRIRIQKVIEPEDLVRLYHLCARCLESSTHLGEGEWKTEEDLLVIGTSSPSGGQEAIASGNPKDQLEIWPNAGWTNRGKKGQYRGAIAGRRNKTSKRGG